MRAHQPTPSFVNRSNVVNLSFYRREKQLRPSRPSGFQQQRTLRTRENLRADYWLDGNHSERMKVNLVVFVFLIFLIVTGVWLLDGLSDAFGPERLSHQHSQARAVSLTAGARVGGSALFDPVGLRDTKVL
jgi:hypothetical protein